MHTLIKHLTHIWHIWGFWHNSIPLTCSYFTQILSCSKRAIPWRNYILERFSTHRKYGYVQSENVLFFFPTHSSFWEHVWQRMDRRRVWMWMVLSAICCIAWNSCCEDRASPGCWLWPEKSPFGSGPSRMRLAVSAAAQWRWSMISIATDSSKLQHDRHNHLHCSLPVPLWRRGSALKANPVRNTGLARGYRKQPPLLYASLCFSAPPNMINQLKAIK